jgi:hypothetical protein
MIKFQEIKVGDYVMADYEGKMWEGEVTGLQPAEKEVCINTGVQEFWFGPDHLHPIPLNDEQLTKLNFQQQHNEDGSVKYMKGAFRILLPRKDDFSTMEIWYREDRRHIVHPLAVHELQNHHMDMTKVHLTRD